MISTNIRGAVMKDMVAISAICTLKPGIRDIGRMQLAPKLVNDMHSIVQHHGVASFRFLVSTPLNKDSHHIDCCTKYQAVLKMNRSFSPFHVKCNNNIFNGSSSWSKGISRSYFGQKLYTIKNFSQLPRHDSVKAGQNIDMLVEWAKTLLFRLMKIIGTFWLIMSLVIIAAPSLLSSSMGLHAATALTNKVIPGKASIKSMSIGWTKPVSIEEVWLQGTDGEAVLIIPKIETKATLWSLITGKAGFGDCTITSPVIDLQEDKHIGISRLALAIIPREKIKRLRKRTVSRDKVDLPAFYVDLNANVKAPGGNLHITNGKVILPEDVAAVIGHKLFLDMFLGHFATQQSQELETDDYNNCLLPLHMGLWSTCMEAKVSGFLNSRKMNIQLIKPIKVEMDLTPAVGSIYLRRINPLLGEVLGPALADEDMPDMTVYISPRNFIFPAEHWKVHIEPMKVVLARGPLAGGILSLLSKASTNIVLERQEIGVETSAIEADFDIGGCLTCARVDLLLAGRIHVATWGNIDLIEETIEMTLGIPHLTLQDVMGLSNLPKNYYLKIPIRGTFDHLEVDWKTASFNIAWLALQQRNGQFMTNFLKRFSSPEEPIPEPSSPVPWKAVSPDSNQR